jgi:hypothetical protein
MPRAHAWQKISGGISVHVIWGSSALHYIHFPLARVAKTPRPDDTDHVNL